MTQVVEQVVIKMLDMEYLHHKSTDLVNCETMVIFYGKNGANTGTNNTTTKLFLSNGNNSFEFGSNNK